MTTVSQSNDTLTSLVKLADQELVVSDEIALYNAVLMYLFRGLNHKAFGARLSKLAGRPVNTRAITDMLNQNGQVIRNIKVWVFYVVKHRCDVHKSNVLASQWGIQGIDVRAFQNVNRTTLAYLRKLAVKFKALTLEKLDESVVSIVKDTRTWLGKFVSRKLRFIIESQGLHRHDIEHELVYKGIQGLYMMYPCVESMLHATNVVKRVIHNQGINMIHHYTTKKKGRLDREANGTFSAKVIGLDDAQLNVLAAPEHRSDMNLDLTKLNDKLTFKQSLFLDLLSGNYCDDFTAWLVNKGFNIDTNEELFDRIDINKYIGLALDWLGVSLKKGMEFLEQLRDMLTPYRTGVAIAA